MTTATVVDYQDSMMDSNDLGDVLLDHVENLSYMNSDGECFLVGARHVVIPDLEKERDDVLGILAQLLQTSYSADEVEILDNTIRFEWNLSLPENTPVGEVIALFTDECPRIIDLHNAQNGKMKFEIIPKELERIKMAG